MREEKLLGHPTPEQRSHTYSLHKRKQHISLLKYFIFVFLIQFPQFFLQDAVVQAYLNIFNSGSK